jgi:excisionase family DNA binding protein
VRANPTPRSLTVAEAAARYRCRKQIVRDLIARGELEAVLVTAGRRKPRLVITAEALAAFEKGHRPATTQKPAPRRRRRPAGFIDFFPD